MMRKNIKRGAILSALLVVAFFLLYLVLLASAVVLWVSLPLLNGLMELVGQILGEV